MADSALEDLKKLGRQAKAAREPFEPDWYLNIAYYDGNQWVFWNRGRLDKPQLAPHRVMIVDNRVLPAVDSRVARKTKTKPTFVATPFSGDESDIKGAEMAEKVFENDWIQQGLHLKHMQVEKWVELCASGFWKIYWDSTKGQGADYVFDTNTNEALLGEDQRPVRAAGAGELVESADNLEIRSVNQGDLAVEVISPFELYPDPLAEDLESCEWIIEEKVRSKEYLIRRFGEQAQGLKENATAPTGLSEGRFANPSNAFRSQDRTDYKGVKTYEYWAKKSSKFPNGKWCVYTDDVILRENDLTGAPFIDCPYVMFRSLLVPGRFWPTCVTTQMRGPQTELNKIKSQIRENAQRLGNPSVLLARSANTDYSGVPGEKIRYDDMTPNSVPSFLQPPEMPAYVQAEIERIEGSLTEISGVHEVSKAQVPSGVTAASAINLLQEADDTRLGPEMGFMEDSLAKAGTKILKLRAKYTNDERLIKIAGEDGDWEVFKFKGDMLGENTNVEVQAGSGLPRSKAAKQALMQEMFDRLLQYGVELDGRSMRKFFREFEVGALDRLFETVSKDEEQVTRENRMLMHGEALDINDWDDDDYHIEAHEEVMKSNRFFTAPEEIQQIMIKHNAAHVERRQQRINMELQMSGDLVPQDMTQQNGQQQQGTPQRANQ